MSSPATERVHERRILRVSARGSAARSANSRPIPARAPAWRRTPARMRRPTSLRIGMFCRFGLLDDSRPVAATAWLNDVCRRPVARVDQRRQRVHVRPLELRQRAVVDDLRGHRVQRRQLFQRVGVRRRAGLGAADDRQRQLAEQHLGQLLGRADVERHAGHGVDLLLQRGDRRADLQRRSRAAGRCPAGCRGTRPWPARAPAAAPSSRYRLSRPLAASLAACGPCSASAAAASAPRRAPTSSTEMSEPGTADAPDPIQLARLARRHAFAAADHVQVVAGARGVQQVRGDHRNPTRRPPASARGAAAAPPASWRRACAWRRRSTPAPAPAAPAPPPPGCSWARPGSGA